MHLGIGLGYRGEEFGGFGGARREPLRRGAIIGSPLEVRQRLQQLGDACDTTELIIAMRLPRQEPSRTIRSLQRFVVEVLPISAPEHERRRM